MRRLLVILLCIVGTISAESSSEEHPEVTAPTGKIRGSIFTSRLGKKIFSFRSVRYAEPPTGQQRFQVATPAADWKDVFDATEDGPGCPGLLVKNISEDCLRLNVYTTKLPSKDENVKRPVLVFFHPGAFYIFSGQSSHFGPEYLMDKDIVLVTVNYRLGTLGFISTGESLAPGNLGLKDQVVALRWVQRNIAAFGGDPNSVTISGYSIGGTSVTLHMLSPMSTNLFHRVIAMSGSILPADIYPTEQKHLAKKQAELLGCPTDTTGSMLICLNSKPVENFTNTITDFFEYYGDPMLIWKPVVEPEVHGVERFLTGQPIDLIRQGKFKQVPLMCGVTKEEFAGISDLFELQARKGNDSLYRDINENWDRVAPISFIYERGTPRSEYITRELKKFYFKDEPISPKNYKRIGEIYADSLVNFPIYRVSKLVAEKSKQPVYLYKFTYEGRYSYAMWNETTPSGVVHHDDLQYLFFIRSQFPFFEQNAPEIPMVELYTSMWSNFVQTGEPIPKNNPLFKNVTWDRLVPERSNYLDINLPPTMKTGYFPERMQEWERLFPLNPLSNSTKG